MSLWSSDPSTVDIDKKHRKWLNKVSNWTNQRLRFIQDVSEAIDKGDSQVGIASSSWLTLLPLPTDGLHVIPCLWYTKPLTSFEEMGMEICPGTKVIIQFFSYFDLLCILSLQGCYKGVEIKFPGFSSKKCSAMEIAQPMDLLLVTFGSFFHYFTCKREVIMVSTVKRCSDDSVSLPLFLSLSLLLPHTVI